MTNHEEFEKHDGDDKPNVTDKRRIDPVTGEPREPATAGSGAAPSAGEPAPTGHVDLGGQAVPADASTTPVVPADDEAGRPRRPGHRPPRLRRAARPRTRSLPRRSATTS